MSEMSNAFHPEMIIAYLTLVLLAILVGYIFKNFRKQIIFVSLHTLAGTAIGGIFGAVIVSVFYWMLHVFNLFTPIHIWTNELLAQHQRGYGFVFALVGMLFGFLFGRDELKFMANEDKKSSSSLSKNSK